MRATPLLIMIATAAVTTLTGCAGEASPVVVNDGVSESLENTLPAADPASGTAVAGATTPGTTPGTAPTAAAPTAAAPLAPVTVTVTPEGKPVAGAETKTRLSTQRRVVGVTKTGVATAITTRIVTPAPITVTRSGAAATVVRTTTVTQTKVQEVPGEIRQICVDQFGKKVACS
ncbi:MAG: hypothetical protein QG622_1473 [Actinomycetota bacterium]|nr:hypothetical protein [Actinomycetota bacterium]